MIKSSPIDIGDVKDFMMHMIQQGAVFVQICSDELRDDRDIIFAVADSCNGDLPFVAQDYQLEHPELVIRAIEKFSLDLQTLRLGLCRDLWQDKLVAMAWLKCGGN